MKTIELVRTDKDPQEVMESEEIADDKAGRRLYAYRLRAELLTRDKRGTYEGRIVPEVEE